ncbi:hypothetical protein COHA_000573 [Chlorella ohadii]|uniref:Uncharacterized protein n=1 Tax=Chlorella ohadii TaxID=2649997 RepID=A0AAD5H680_9CHLO|nr:hypothetical protein COHA_000573 [Chlorella ohadii]
MPAPSALLGHLRALASVATAVTSPQTTPPARTSCRCCCGRFEDPDLLRRASDAADGLGGDTQQLGAACAREPAARREAVALATDLLPAALRLNMRAFEDPAARSISARSLVLPEALFFTLLQVESDLCLALFSQLTGPERSRLLQALVPVQAGCLTASCAAYGYEYLFRIGKLGGTWEEIGGDYAPLFFASEVQDQAVPGPNQAARPGRVFRELGRRSQGLRRQLAVRRLAEPPVMRCQGG